MKNNYIVYKHTSPSGKSYIGITNDYSRRCYEHLKNTKAGSELVFHRAIRKYSWEAFKHEIVTDNITKEEAIRLEALLIKELNTLVPNGYNMLSTSFGMISSEELRKHKIANRKESVKGYYYDKRNNNYRLCLSYLGKFLFFGAYSVEADVKVRADYLMSLSDTELLIEFERCKANRPIRLKGYTFDKKECKFKVRIKIDGKVKQFGSYKTEQEAIDRVKELISEKII